MLARLVSAGRGDGLASWVSETPVPDKDLAQGSPTPGNWGRAFARMLGLDFGGEWSYRSGYTVVTQDKPSENE